MFPSKEDRGVQVWITLNKLQKEAAKFSGITEQEYAQQLIRLIEEKMTETLFSKDQRNRE